MFNSHEIPTFFSVNSGELQGTHSAETDLCWHCSAKGARQVGSAQAQELVGGNHLVTCLCEKNAQQIRSSILFWTNMNYNKIIYKII